MAEIRSQASTKPAIVPRLVKPAPPAYLPGVVKPAGLSHTPRSVLNRARSDPTAQTVAGANSLVPVVYGRWRCGAKIVAVVTQGTYLYVSAVWCVAQIDAIEEILFNDAAPNNVMRAGGIVLGTHYGCNSAPTSGGLHQLGVAGGIDPWLQAAFLSAGKTYTDTNPGVCYSVLRIPTGAVSGFPILTAKVRGLLVRQTEGGARVWSDNPAYCLADFIEDDAYGAGLAVDWTDVATVAGDCDSLIGTPAEKKRVLNLALDNYQPAETWINVLRDYAGCFAVLEGGSYSLPLDAATDVVATFDESNIVDGSLRVHGKRGSEQPTVVTVEYTDTSAAQYTTARVTQPPNGVPLNGAPKREAVIAKPGTNRYSEANRYAIQRLNEYTVGGVTASWQAVDMALVVRRGDVVTVNHPIGFGPVTGYDSGKPFRVLDAEQVEPGRWNITALSFDPAKYSIVVVAGPSLDNTNLPDPTAPPAPTGLTVTEDVYQVQTGRFGSRLRISWDAADWPFADGFVVTVTQAGTVVDGPTIVITGTEHLTKQLTENLEYVVSVAMRSTAGTVGTAAATSITNNGKQAKPGDVPALRGFEVGGEVRLDWDSASDLDLTGHEIRYSATGGTWESATLLDRVASPAVRYTTKSVPAGTWRFWIKGLDSVRSPTYPNGQESVNAAFVDIAVTSDANAFVAATQALASPTLLNMSGSGPWVTDFGDTWNALFTSSLSTYTNPLSSYHTAGSSGLLTAITDIGSTISGDWMIDPDYTDLDGAATVSIEVNASGGETAKSISGATNANPIVITCTAHGYSTNDEIVIAGVGGNTAANGTRRITVLTANTFSLQDVFGNNVAGNGAYTSGGTVSRWLWQSFVARSVKATARYCRMRMITAGAMRVDSLGNLNVNVVARREGATVTTSASAPTIITFASKYSAAVSVNVTPQGTSAAVGTYDSVEVSGNRGVGVGQALRFNGSSDYVTVPDSVPLRLATAITIEAQIKFNAITGATQGIVRKDTEAAGTRYVWGIQLSNDGRLWGLYGNATSIFQVLSISPPAVGRWMHLAMTISGTLLSLYLDGVLQGTATISGVQGAPTGRLGIGANPINQTHASFFEFCGGVIDDVRIWNVARTQAQLVASMNTPLAGTESGLVGYWKFDSLSGTVATDSTANANHGTVTGAKWRPLDGMDIYAFNSAGSQIAVPASWAFSGV